LTSALKYGCEEGEMLAANSAMKIKMTILALMIAATPQTKAAIHRAFKPDHFELLWVSDSSDAVEAAGRKCHDLFLLDVNEGNHRGREILENLKSLNPDTPIVVLIENETWTGLPGAGQTAAVIRKPFDMENLVTTVRALLQTPLPAIVSDTKQGLGPQDAIVVELERVRASMHRQAFEQLNSVTPYDHWGIND